MDAFAQQLVNGLTLGSLYALIAVGYTVVYGIVQLINFAHGEIFMIGAFGALVDLADLLRGQHLALWVLPIMMLGAILASVTTPCSWSASPTGRCGNAPRLAPLITAIGISVFLQEAVRLFYGRSLLRLPGRQAARPVPARSRWSPGPALPGRRA